MSKNSNDNQPYGSLGKVFQFTRDDLAANQAGYLTLPQQFGFKFWERKLYGWFLRLPFVNPPRRVATKITGKVKKHFHSKIIFTGSGGSGGGHQDVLEQRQLKVITQDEIVTFYVREKQFNALPENVAITLYYDTLENRILSVEPPYANEQI